MNSCVVVIMERDYRKRSRSVPKTYVLKLDMFFVVEPGIPQDVPLQLYTGYLEFRYIEIYRNLS